MLKKSKDNSFFILIIALILAFIAAFTGKMAIDNYLEVETVYKIAANTLEERTVLQEKHLMKVKVPRSEIHGEAVRNLEEIKGKALTTRAYYGQQIIHPILSSYKKRNDLTQEIGENRRAVTVPLDPYTSFGGNIQDTDRVDIIGNFDSLSDYNANFSRVILSNVKILKVIKSGESIPMIIVEVSPNDAEILEYAKSQGSTLGITLVPYSDSKKHTNTYGVSAQMFFNQYMPKAK